MLQGRRSSFARNLRIINRKDGDAGTQEPWSTADGPATAPAKNAGKANDVAGGPSAGADAPLEAVLEGKLERALSRRVRQRGPSVAGRCIVVGQSPSMRGTAPLEHAMHEVADQWDRVVLVSVLSNYPKLPALPSEDGEESGA